MGAYSLWDGVLSSLDLAEELLRYAVVEGELAVEHGEQDHAERPHVAGFTAVRPTCAQQHETQINNMKQRLSFFFFLRKEEARIARAQQSTIFTFALWPRQILSNDSELISPPASRLLINMTND